MESLFILGEWHNNSKGWLLWHFFHRLALSFSSHALRPFFMPVTRWLEDFQLEWFHQHIFWAFVVSLSIIDLFSPFLFYPIRLPTFVKFLLDVPYCHQYDIPTIALERVRYEENFWTGCCSHWLTSQIWFRSGFAFNLRTLESNGHGMSFLTFYVCTRKMVVKFQMKMLGE